MTTIGNRTGTSSRSMLKCCLLLLTIAFSLVGTRGYAQENQTGSGQLELTVIPGGGTFFMKGDNAPGFGNYDLGAAVTYNFNRFVGIEGELNGALGIKQDLTLNGLRRNERTPNTLGYAANVVLSAPARNGVVAYAAGGLGGLTMFERNPLDIASSETFFTGNVGGGLKWYSDGRLGLRADYRFMMVPSNDDAPSFFGQEARYGHRLYGGVIVKLVR